MNHINDIFRPHQILPPQTHIDLYHVYDNLSRTPFKPGIGIECEDPDNYFMHPSYVVTPESMTKHLTWNNRERTQFISFYGTEGAATREKQRRIIHSFGQRDSSSVRIAHVRLPADTNVWFFSRTEMLQMMGTFGGNCRLQVLPLAHPDEWFIWGAVSDQNVVNGAELAH